MKKIILLIVLSLTFFNVQAHGIDVSTMMLVEQENNTWTLHVRSSLESFRKEIKKHYSGALYSSEEEFKTQLLQYFKNTLKISVNDEENIILSNGQVRLGHETIVFFDNILLPKKLSSLKFISNTFKDIFKSKVKLLILKKGFDKKALVLSDKNNFTANLSIEGKTFVTYKKPGFPLFIWISLTLIICGFIVFIYKNSYFQKSNK